ncbi:Uncharacterized protein TCM_023960 [Theobroma cacao]|uniref:RNase H type-1 domain-containing protein n=1 Tax=Theobroma cacao TaxID=3641 RepID=A0A061F2Q3_THECC|nr:Uncharacterized protein TCM_023960 [Theobroma cacao]
MKRSEVVSSLVRVRISYPRTKGRSTPVINWILVELRMKSKGFHLASKCLCCCSEESLLHVIWEGTVAQQVWNFFAKFFQIYVHNPQNVLHILHPWYYSGDYVKPGHIRILLPLLIMWFLWVERNDAKHKELKMYPNRVIWRIMRMLRQLYQDGSSKEAFQNAASGGVLRDHTSTMIFGFFENFGPYSSIQAELMALHRGLLLCNEYNISRVWIEMDAKAIVQMLHKGHKGSSRTRYLLSSIHQCLSGISYRISHIHRQGNQAVDYLSNKGHTHQNLQVFSEAEGELKGMIRLDKSNLPYVHFK